MIKNKLSSQFLFSLLRPLSSSIRFLVILIFSNTILETAIFDYTFMINTVVIFASLGGMQAYSFFLRKSKNGIIIDIENHRVLTFSSLIIFAIICFIYDFGVLIFIVGCFELFLLENGRLFIVKQKTNYAHLIQVIGSLLYLISVLILVLFVKLNFFVVFECVFLLGLFCNLIIYLRLTKSNNKVDLRKIKKILYFSFPLVISQFIIMFQQHGTKFYLIEHFDNLIFVKYSNMYTLLNSISTFLTAYIISYNATDLANNKDILDKKLILKITKLYLFCSISILMLFPVVNNLFNGYILFNYKVLILILISNLFLLLNQINTLTSISLNKTWVIPVSMIPGFIMVFSLYIFKKADIEIFSLIIACSSVTFFVFRKYLNQKQIK